MTCALTALLFQKQPTAPCVLTLGTGKAPQLCTRRVTRTVTCPAHRRPKLRPTEGCQSQQPVQGEAAGAYAYWPSASGAGATFTLAGFGLVTTESAP